MNSLKALGTDKMEFWYLHAPDRTTPFALTMRGICDLYKEGPFKRFAMSNFRAWEVAQMFELCEANVWVQPSVYQVFYNAAFLTFEFELLSCLRQYGIAFYAYNPLGGDYFTGRYSWDSDDKVSVEPGSRFDKNRVFGKLCGQRYWTDVFFDALGIIQPVVEKHGLTEAEAALRWMTHHSMLTREKGDAVIIDASSTKNIERNLLDLEKGPFPDHVLEALDAAWERVKITAFMYWH